MADKPFTIIGVNSDQDIGQKELEEIRQVVKEKSLTWRSFQNTSNEEKISTTWNVKGWPTTYLIDKDGKIRYKNLRGDELDKALEVLMAEMGEEVKLIGVDHEAEDEAALAAANDIASVKAKNSAEEIETAEVEKSDDSVRVAAKLVAPAKEASAGAKDADSDEETSDVDSADKKETSDK